MYFETPRPIYYCVKYEKRERIMKNKHSYEIELLSDFIDFLKLNNYEITLKHQIKSYDRLQTRNESEQILVKFHFDLVKPSKNRILSEIKMFCLMNLDCKINS